MVVKGNYIRLGCGAAGAEEHVVFINHVANQVRNVGKLFTAVGKALC